MSPCWGDTKGQAAGPRCGPSPSAQGVGDPALPVPRNMACTLPAAPVARKKKRGWEGACSLEVGAGLERQPLGLTLESRLRHVPPRAPQPSPRGCLWRGTALGPVDPALPRVPGALLLLRLLRPWWRVSRSAGRCLGSLSSPSWCIIYLKRTHLEGLLTNFACVYTCVTSIKVTTRNVPGPASGPRTAALHPYSDLDHQAHCLLLDIRST